MAVLQFSDLYTEVENLSSSQVGVAEAKTAVNVAYRRITRMRRWFGLERTTTFSAGPDETTGTVALTQNSATVTGTGTAFVSGDAGRYLVVGAREPLRIASVGGATTLTLAQPWGEPAVSGIACQVTTLRFTLPSDAERILSIRGPEWPVVRRAKDLVDFYDPARQTRGTPVIYYEAEIINKVREFELWPVPNQAITFWRSERLLVPALSADGDVPLVDAAMVEAYALMYECQKLKARTGDATWSDLSQEHKAEFERLYDEEQRQDRRMRGAHPQALDSEDAVQLWDTGFLSALRQFQTLGLSSIA